MLADPNLVKNSNRQEYRDFKNLLYGGISSGPLSLKLPLLKSGPVLICEAPGIWGHLPSGFEHIWIENMVEVYITFNIPDYNRFIFNKNEATLMKLHYNKDQLELCTQLYIEDLSKANFSIGNHVITIIPTHKELKVLLAWIVTA